MYERFYGFTERPFSLLPDPDFLFLGEKHQTALDLLELTMFNQTGFCVVSGEIGAGKTTLVRELLNRLNDDICVGLISNTHPSFGELLQWIMAAFDLSSESADQFELHKRFLDFVIQQYSDNKRTLLIIDEAQNLSVSAMEELRMLSNVNSDRDLVLQVILVGQTQLRDKLQLPELQQFAQRIGADYHLTGLDEQETYDYIRYRVTHAGGSADLFSEDACRTIYRCSDGIPRLINGICDLCLVYGYSDKRPRITPELVREVVNDQRSGHIRSSAGKLSPQAGDVAMTSTASTPVEGAALIEQKCTAHPQAESASAELLGGQRPDPQEKMSRLEKTASEHRARRANAEKIPPSSDTAAETIVGAMEAMLLQQAVASKAVGAAQPTASGNDSAGLAGRHRLVAAAQPDTGNVHRQSMASVSRLLMGLVLLMGLGLAGWLSWQAWDQPPAARTVAADSAESAVPSTRVNVPDIDPLTEENADNPARRREAERLERERLVAEKRLAEQREVERLEQERQAAEKRLAELREAERLERQRLAAEKRLVEEREAKRAAALAAWKKANSGIGWAEEIEDGDDEGE
jgi:type II secretory pathway predicted ATPase ExeA